MLYESFEFSKENIRAEIPLKMIQLKMFILRINSGPEKLRGFLKVIQLLHGRASNVPPTAPPTMYYLQPCTAAFSPYCTKDVHVYSPLSILCIIYYSYSVTHSHIPAYECWS